MDVIRLRFRPMDISASRRASASFFHSSGVLAVTMGGNPWCVGELVMLHAIRRRLVHLVVAKQRRVVTDGPTAPVSVLDQFDRLATVECWERVHWFTLIGVGLLRWF